MVLWTKWKKKKKKKKTTTMQQPVLIIFPGFGFFLNEENAG